MKIVTTIFLVMVMFLGITTTGSVALAQGSSDVITESDAGGGDLTGKDIFITIMVILGVLFLIGLVLCLA